MDAGNDLIMNEELDDISYHQNDHELHLLASDGSQENVLDLLDIEDSSIFENMDFENIGFSSLNKIKLIKIIMKSKVSYQPSWISDPYPMTRLRISPKTRLIAIAGT